MVAQALAQNFWYFGPNLGQSLKKEHGFIRNYKKMVKTGDTEKPPK